MTLPEFKAWFGGFTENITKLPTQKQWARIQARVKEIDSAEKVIEQYYERRPWWPQWYIASTTLVMDYTSTDATRTISNLASSDSDRNVFAPAVDCLAAAHDIGASEAQAL